MLEPGEVQGLSEDVCRMSWGSTGSSIVLCLEYHRDTVMRTVMTVNGVAGVQGGSP